MTSYRPGVNPAADYVHRYGEQPTEFINAIREVLGLAPIRTGPRVRQDCERWAETPLSVRREAVWSSVWDATEAATNSCLRDATSSCLRGGNIGSILTRD